MLDVALVKFTIGDEAPAKAGAFLFSLCHLELPEAVRDLDFRLRAFHVHYVIPPSPRHSGLDPESMSDAQSSR